MNCEGQMPIFLDTSKIKDIERFHRMGIIRETVQMFLRDAAQVTALMKEGR